MGQLLQIVFENGMVMHRTMKSVSSISGPREVPKLVPQIKNHLMLTYTKGDDDTMQQ